MPFHTADYDVYVVLGNPETPPLWNWNIWRRFVPSIEPLMQAARGKPAIRTTQYLPNRAGVVKFGRLGWKEGDHQKWSHGSPTNESESKSWSFLNLEVWAPAWTLCERENRAPDVFLSVADESLGGIYRQAPLFNPTILFAVVSELATQEPSLVSRVVSALREVVSAKLVGYRRRPWGKGFGSGGFTNAIQDLPLGGLFKPGPRHKGSLGIELFAEEWSPVSLGSASP